MTMHVIMVMMQEGPMLKQEFVVCVQNFWRLMSCACVSFLFLIGQWIDFLEFLYNLGLWNMRQMKFWRN